MDNNVAVLRYPDVPTTVQIPKLFLVGVTPTYLDLPPSLVGCGLFLAGGTLRLSNTETYFFGQPYDIAHATTRWPLDALARSQHIAAAELSLRPQVDGWVTLHFETDPSAEDYSTEREAFQQWARKEFSEIRRLRQTNAKINRDLEIVEGYTDREDGWGKAYAAATQVARALRRRRPAHPGSAEEPEKRDQFRAEVQELCEQVKQRNADLRRTQERLQQEYDRRAKQLHSLRPPQAQAVTVHIFRTLEVGSTTLRLPVVERIREETVDRR
jgi:hypothetical protein